MARKHYRAEEIVMPGASNAHEALRRSDQTIQGLAERHGDDQIGLAVPHRDWCGDLADPQIRAKLILINRRTGTNQ